MNFRDDLEVYVSMDFNTEIVICWMIWRMHFPKWGFHTSFKKKNVASVPTQSASSLDVDFTIFAKVARKMGS
jgi:hypothetical protein